MLLILLTMRPRICAFKINLTTKNNEEKIMIKKIIQYLCVVVGAAALIGALHTIDSSAMPKHWEFRRSFSEIVPISGGNGDASGDTVDMTLRISDLRTGLAVADAHYVTLRPTKGCYAKQGDSATDTASYGTLATTGSYLAADTNYRVLVTYTMDNIAVITAAPGTDTGVLYIRHHETGMDE